jgi:hypothetical protein
MMELATFMFEMLASWLGRSSFGSAISSGGGAAVAVRPGNTAFLATGLGSDFGADDQKVTFGRRMSTLRRCSST